MHLIRLVVTSLCAIVAILHADASARSHLSADDGLDELLAEYRLHELPFPPASAKLVIRDRSDGSTDGVHQSQRELAFRLEPEKATGAATYWIGCEPVSYDRPRPDEVAEPSGELVAKTRAAELDYLWIGFRTLPDLLLAVQCKARGWDDLARGLLERSRRPTGSRWFDSPQFRPRDDRRALATLAWNYWCNQFAKSTGDRKKIVDRLQRLLDGSYGLNSQARRNIVADMIETLAKRDVAPGGFEADIEALLDLHEVRNRWTGFPSEPANTAGKKSSFTKLRAAGLDAAPALIAHLRDFRLTRCFDTSWRGRYTWHVRVADVAAVLLSYLNPSGFAYDFHMVEGRGRSLDQAHVNHWWAEVLGTTTLDYLKTNAISIDSQGSLLANEELLLALGQRFPDQFVSLFKERVDQVSNPHALFNALASSKVSDEHKATLFLAAATNQSSRNRYFPLQHLLRLRHSQAVTLLVREFDALPRTPKVPYSQSGAAQFARLVNLTDDDRAWQAFERTARRVDIGQRLEMLEGLGRGGADREDRRLAMFARFLDDEEARTIPEWTGFDRNDDVAKEAPLTPEKMYGGVGAGFMIKRLAVRDFAALHIADSLHLNANGHVTRKEEEWLALRKRVRAALAERDSREQPAKKDPRP